MIILPIGSMYAIYGNIYHQYTPNVSIYTSTMDPMGIGSASPTNTSHVFPRLSPQRRHLDSQRPSCAASMAAALSLAERKFRTVTRSSSSLGLGDEKTAKLWNTLPQIVMFHVFFCCMGFDEIRDRI